MQCVYLACCSECLVKAGAHFGALTFPQGQLGAIEGSGQRKDLGRFSHKGSGEPLKVLSRGKTWADVCFQNITLLLGGLGISSFLI